MVKKAPNPIDKHVGSRVRMRRMMLSMSQEKLGDALGLTFQQVQKYEKGTNRIGASRLQQIAQILQVPVAFFFEGAPNVPAARPTGMREAPSPAYVSDFLASSEGLALTGHSCGSRNPSCGGALSTWSRRSPAKRMNVSATVVVPPEARFPTATNRPKRCICPHLDPASGRCKKPPRRPGRRGVLYGEFPRCHARTTCSPASPFPKAIPTRSATRSRMRSWMRSSRTTSSSASPTTAR